ncbi:MAG: ABC transporter substrate-binding protein [Burkholderiales bacterium]|nr:ABC transporter substrate-binding protein [Burkholderiales bacterium]
MNLKSLALICAALVSFGASAQPKHIAITSFGEHPALQQVIDGMKASMKERGYVDGRDVTYSFTHVNWERNVIPQMLTKVAAGKPDVIVTITTPVTQTAVRAIGDRGVPIVFSAVQDPVVAGVIPSWDKPSNIMTGASNLADMEGTLRFIKQLLPNAKRLGLPYNPGDDADNALRQRLEKFAPKYGLELVMVGVDNVNDMPQRLQTLAGKADAVYVIPSNLFQPVTSQIAAITNRLGIPAFNGLPAPILKHEMLATYSVDWPKIGANTAAIVEKVLKGAKVSEIPPSVPSPNEHKILISGPQLEQYKIPLPASLKDCNCVLGK